MRFVFISLFLLLVIGCSAVRVTYDYDKTTDFSNYTTYNYFSDIETGLSALDAKRLFRVLDSTLQTKGFLLSEEPDFLVNILSQEFRNASQSAVGVGVGGTNRNLAVGFPSVFRLAAPSWSEVYNLTLLTPKRTPFFGRPFPKADFAQMPVPRFVKANCERWSTRFFPSFPRIKIVIGSLFSTVR